MNSSRMQFDPISWCSVKIGLFVQNHTQERSIDLKTAVVLDETQFPELVHEKIDP